MREIPMSKRAILFVLLGGLCTPIIATAGDMGARPEMNSCTLIATLTAGSDFVNTVQTSKATLDLPSQNIYKGNNGPGTVADVGAFVGLEQEFSDSFSVQFGVAGYADEPIMVKGKVWPFFLPGLAGLNYTYQIHHSRIMASTKLLTSLSQHPALNPYVSAELGAARNLANDYQESPFIAGTLPWTQFSGNSRTSLAWSLGVGLDYNLGSHFRLGAGYQYSDLGPASLGPTRAALTTQTLGLSHIYANQLRCSLTILI